MTVAETREVVEREFPVTSIFKSFNEQPIASASIAQVHHAILKNGEEVAVKIVRNGVHESLAVNTHLLLRIITVLDFLVPSLKPLQLPARLLDFQLLLLRQTDMMREAEEMESIRGNFEGHPFAYIPKVYREFSASRILVMEFVTGIPGKQSHHVDIPPAKLAYRLIEVMLTMIYMHGFFHADAHPGNVLFTKDGRIILLDFGMTEKLTEEEKWVLASFYYAVTRKEWAIATERYTRCFVVDRRNLDQHWHDYQEDMIACLQEHFGSKRKWDTAQFAHDTVSIFEKYGTRESTQWTKIEIALVSLEGFVSQIDPDVDIWEASRKFNERYSLYLSSTLKHMFDDYYDQSIPRSIALEKQAKNVLVAPTHLDRYFLPANYPLFIKSAYGSTLEDIDGNTYVELHGGYGPYILGYAHPAVEQAIKETITQGTVCALGNLHELKLMELLIEAIPSAEKGLFCNSGTEGCNIAISLCRAYRKKQTVAKFEGHYHGFLDQGTVSSWFRVHGPLDAPLPINGSAGSSDLITDNTVVLQYGHSRSLERIREHADHLACVIIEPMPASMVTCNDVWLKALREVCTKVGVPLIFDEVVTGFRVAYGGMQSLINVMPDLTVLGKIIGGGLPCGAVVGKQEIIDKAKSTRDPFRDYEEIAFTGGTLAGNSLSCAAGAAQVDFLRQHPEIYENLRIHTTALVTDLTHIIERLGVPCKVGGYRSMFTLAFRSNKPKYYREKFSDSDVRANIALAYYMRKFNVYMAELHTYFISNAHTKDDLQKVAWAFEESLKLMVKEGIFTK